MTWIPIRPRTGAHWARALAPLVLFVSLGLAPAAAPTDPEVLSFVRQVSAHRVSIGLPPLIWDRRVAVVARAHSRDMATRHFFSHTNPDGLRSRDRLRDAGIAYVAMGENIAFGQTTGASVLNSWLESPGHRANIENPTYTRHGVGKVGTHWTHVFLRPKATTTASR